MEKTKIKMEEIKATILITSFKEPNVERAIIAALSQDTKENYEVVVTDPDDETKKLVEKFHKTNKNIRFLKDPGKGKSFALNTVFSKLKGEVWILTDGDIYLDKQALKHILDTFENKKVGCITGRIVPTNSKNTITGYWAHLLADAGAHTIRNKLSSQNKFIECSGYLFAFRKGLISKIPLDVAEDAFIPYTIHKKGYLIKYVPKARVYVKNPTTVKDFVKQRIRTAKAHETLTKYIPDFPKVKSFKNEIKEGTLSALKYPSTFKEFIWTLQLFAARLYIWYRVLYEHNIAKKQYKDAWERVETTKIS